jgi:hypothetical protein
MLEEVFSEGEKHGSVPNMGVDRSSWKYIVAGLAFDDGGYRILMLTTEEHRDQLKRDRHRLLVPRS